MKKHSDKKEIRIHKSNNPKTKFLKMDLMTPNQISKDILFNTAIKRIDLMLGGFVQKIISTKTSGIETSKCLYIFNSSFKTTNPDIYEEKNNKICFYDDNIGEYINLTPSNGNFVIILDPFSIGFFNGIGWIIKHLQVK